MSNATASSSHLLLCIFTMGRFWLDNREKSNDTAAAMTITTATVTAMNELNKYSPNWHHTQLIVFACIHVLCITWPIRQMGINSNSISDICVDWWLWRLQELVGSLCVYTLFVGTRARKTEHLLLLYVYREYCMLFININIFVVPFGIFRTQNASILQCLAKFIGNSSIKWIECTHFIHKSIWIST